MGPWANACQVHQPSQTQTATYRMQPPQPVEGHPVPKGATEMISVGTVPGNITNSAQRHYSEWLA